MATKGGEATDNEYRTVGKYQLKKTSKDDKCIVYIGFDSAKPKDQLRVKAFIRDAVETRVIANLIKVQEHLARCAVRIYARYQFLYALQQKGQAVGSANLTDEQRAEQQRTQTDFPDSVIPFLSMCSQHLCYLQDKLNSSSKIYLVREHMPTSLASVLAMGRLPEEGALYYFFQLLQAVFFLHECRVNHRGICAEHVLLSADGATLKLSGFGGVIFDPAYTTSSGGGAASSVNNNESFFGASFASAGLSMRGGEEDESASTYGGGGGSAGPLPPGSYGTCPHCGHEVPIVANVVTPSLMGKDGKDDGTASPTSASPTPPPVNTLFTTCKNCGIPINRLQVLQSAVGSPAYLAPEILVPQHPVTSMVNSLQATSLVALQEQMRKEEADNVLFNKYFRNSSSTAQLTSGQAKDMWSLGVVLFAMLTSTLPFDHGDTASARSGDNHTGSSNSNNNSSSSTRCRPYGGGGQRTPDQVYAMCINIVSVNYTIPSYVSPGAAELIQCLLTRSPKRRPSVQDLMRHPALAAARTTLGCGD